MKDSLHINAVPANDQERVKALARYQIMHSPAEESFNRIARLATLVFNVPIAHISFIDTDNIFVKAKTGLTGGTTYPRNTSLCTLVILKEDILFFENIPEMDPCIMADPVMIAELGFKFYAGAPIKTPDGFNIGTICLIGTQPRSFSEKDGEILKHMAMIVMDEIELRLKGIEK